MTAELEPGDGERRLKEKGQRYINIISGLLAAGGVTGIAAGIPLGLHFGRHGFHDTNFPASLQWITIAAVALFVVSVVVGSWIYFKAIDELELEANKLAGVIGLNVYGVLFMGWWPLAKVGVVGPPDGEAIFLITMAAAIAAFCWRRFR